MDTATQKQLQSIQASQQKLIKDRLRQKQYELEEQSWNSVQGKDENFEILRELLVDMCVATQSESPPSEEDWNKIRERVKKTATEHALLHREKMKAPKKSTSWETTPLRYGKSIMDRIRNGIMTTPLMQSRTLSGRSADLLIIDDIYK